ncbi:MAG: LuxR C-terminal-related transcriptional regulator [Bacteroidales bacterium]|nr:LuxR C-terminal-related transcriptional regulator [Bacteroidales bacterium]
MEQIDTKKVKVVIAAEQFLYRLGIKTIISVIGVEPELFETYSFNDTKQCLQVNSGINFLVLNEDIVPEPKDTHLKKLKAISPKCNLMLIGNKPVENCPFTSQIVNIENQKELVEKFQEFFFEPEKNNDTNGKVLLSEREIDVLKAVALGYSNKEISDKLYISTNTVITHRKNITDKLGIKTISGLTVYAIMNKLIKPEEVKSS